VGALHAHGDAAWREGEPERLVDGVADRVGIAGFAQGVRELRSGGGGGNSEAVEVGRVNGVLDAPDVTLDGAGVDARALGDLRELGGGLPALVEQAGGGGEDDVAW